jgi:hypothetical protein
VPSSDKCNQQKFSRQQMLAESCCTANITTESDDSTSYTVREGMLWSGMGPALGGGGGGGGGVRVCSASSGDELCPSCGPPTHQLA